LLFSLTRCGSTTLRHLLNCHPRIRCFEEPFNPFNYKGKYLKQVRDESSLDEILQEIGRRYNGIKHTWGLDGWPFPDKELNTLLLLRPNQKVFYLRRRNLLRRRVSFHISNQTGIWGQFNEHDRKKLVDCQFAAMNVEATRWHLDWERRMLTYYRQLLTHNSSIFMDLWYEDLYNSEVAGRGKIEMLDNMFAFLGEGPIVEAGALERVRELFDASTMKLNSMETYLRIPGIEELDKQCGSDETGWLFKDQISPTSP
jgi:hypothetical protein